MGYILVGSLTRLKTLVYKINGAEYIKVYIKHNGELNPDVIPEGLQHIYFLQKNELGVMCKESINCAPSSVGMQLHKSTVASHGINMR